MIKQHTLIAADPCRLTPKNLPMSTHQRGERPTRATSNFQLSHDQARRHIGAKTGKIIMETAKEVFFRAISRPGDRTCWPPQRSMKWIAGGFLISQAEGLPNLIVIYTYLFTNQKKFTALFIYSYRIYNRFNFSINFCNVSLCISNYKNSIYFNIFYI
jgi:hypothetical protein